MTTHQLKENSWHREDSQLFWCEKAAGEHVIHIYDSEESLLQVLETFVVGGIRGGDSVVVVGTKVHLAEIFKRVASAGFDPLALKLKEQFIPVEADALIPKFFVNGSPDEILFNHHFNKIFRKAKAGNRHVRAFGEMVALLYARGLTEQTVQLEILWNKFCRANCLSLFCAFPEQLLNRADLQLVCCEHSKLVTMAAPDSNDILFKPLSVV